MGKSPRNMQFVVFLCVVLLLGFMWSLANLWQPPSLSRKQWWMSRDWDVCGPPGVNVKLPVNAGECDSWERHMYLRFASLYNLKWMSGKNSVTWLGSLNQGYYFLLNINATHSCRVQRADVQPDILSFLSMSGFPMSIKSDSIEHRKG